MVEVLLNVLTSIYDKLKYTLLSFLLFVMYLNIFVTIKLQISTFEILTLNVILNKVKIIKYFTFA